MGSWALCSLHTSHTHTAVATVSPAPTHTLHALRALRRQPQVAAVNRLVATMQTLA